MAAARLPGSVHTQPDIRIVFNAPFDEKHTYRVKIINVSNHRVAWTIRTTHPERRSVDPTCGVLDYNESALVSVSCDSFDFAAENTQNERITIEWTNTPRGAAKKFQSQWLTGPGHGMVRRKDLPIEYNP